MQFNELIKRSTDISSTSLAVVELYFVASIWYLILTSVFSVGQYYLERRYARGSSRTPAAHPPAAAAEEPRPVSGSFRRPEVSR
ncbi:hypothetical protein AB7952_08175 [Streptomyces sp. PG2]